jgi:hypothetical protein
MSEKTALEQHIANIEKEKKLVETYQRIGEVINSIISKDRGYSVYDFTGNFLNEGLGETAKKQIINTLKCERERIKMLILGGDCDE